MIREMAMQFVGMYIGAMLLMCVGGLVIFKISDVLEAKKAYRQMLAQRRRERAALNYINSRKDSYGYKVRYR